MVSTSKNFRVHQENHQYCFSNENDKMFIRYLWINNTHPHIPKAQSLMLN